MRRKLPNPYILHGIGALVTVSLGVSSFVLKSVIDLNEKVSVINNTIRNYDNFETRVSQLEAFGGILEERMKHDKDNSSRPPYQLNQVLPKPQANKTKSKEEVLQDVENG